MKKTTEAPHCIELTISNAQAFFARDAWSAEPVLNADIAQHLLQSVRRLPSSKQPVRITISASLESASDNVAALQLAVKKHFLARARAHTQQIHDVFRYARVSTAIGFVVVVLLIAVAQAIPDDAGSVMNGLREMLTIFAWVAMWKPADLWLYAHLPERHWRRLCMQLASAEVVWMPKRADVPQLQ